MFTVKNCLAKIVSCTNVSEKHGKERKPAISIGLYLVGPSKWLDQYDTAIRGMLWRKPMPSPGDLPLDAGEDDLTELRFPFMRNLAWEKQYAGYLLRFHVGASGAEDILLAECKVKDIRFVAQEGGSCGYGMKVTAHPKDEHDHGWLGRHVQQEIPITLTPPEHYADPDLFDSEPPRDDSEDPFAHSDLAQDETRID